MVFVSDRTVTHDDVEGLELEERPVPNRRIAVGVVVSQLQGAEEHPDAIDYKEVDTRTTGGFNLAALVIILMLAGLYATWW